MRNLDISRCCFADDGRDMFKDFLNARAQPLICSLNLLLGDVPVAVVVVIREFKITTTATRTGTSLNKRFNEQNNGCARAL